MHDSFCCEFVIHNDSVLNSILSFVYEGALLMVIAKMMQLPGKRTWGIIKGDWLTVMLCKHFLFWSSEKIWMLLIFWKYNNITRITLIIKADCNHKVQNWINVWCKTCGAISCIAWWLTRPNYTDQSSILVCVYRAICLAIMFLAAWSHCYVQEECFQ